ncbi:MAG: oligosaccharide flippase family protein, partial [Ignavibacteria bacterium]|nr:oligosaccharide flippase family protein [Ignavibacteria bacterium]
MDYLSKINLFNLTKTAKQTIALYFSQIGAMVFGVLFTILNTRLLTKTEFGTLNFYIQVLTFVALIFEFGYFTAGSRLIAIERDYQKERELIGTLYILGLIISLAYIFTLLLISFFVDDIFKSNVKFLILIGLIPSLAFPFQFLVQLVFQGSNEVLKLSLYTLLPRLLYFVFIGVAYLINLFNLISTSLLYVLSFFIATIVTVIISKPSLKNFQIHLKEIVRETKEYGFKVYIGRVTGMIGYQSNVLLIQFFAKEIEVANYSLINFFTTPISVFSRSLCTSLFKGFAHLEKIPSRVFKINFIWLAVVSLIYLLIGGFIIEFLFSKKYSEAIPLILPMVIANFFMGAFQPYNFFLTAKGKGNYILRIA